MSNDAKSSVKNRGPISNIVSTSLKPAKEEKDNYENKEQNSAD